MIMKNEVKTHFLKDFGWTQIVQKQHVRGFAGSHKIVSPWLLMLTHSNNWRSRIWTDSATKSYTVLTISNLSTKLNVNKPDWYVTLLLRSNSNKTVLRFSQRRYSFKSGREIMAYLLRSLYTISSLTLTYYLTNIFDFLMTFFFTLSRW